MFKENPSWKNRPPGSGGVTWDGECYRCNFKLVDRSFIPGMVAIEGGGRRLARVFSVINHMGENFFGTKEKIVCSICCPNVLKNTED